MRTSLCPVTGKRYMIATSHLILCLMCRVSGSALLQRICHCALGLIIPPRMTQAFLMPSLPLKRLVSDFDWSLLQICQGAA